MQIEYFLEQCISDYEARYGLIPLRGSTQQNMNQNDDNILSVNG